MWLSDPNILVSSAISSPGSKCSSYGGDKVYLGVRVKMPVKDLLRNIRVAQGWDPQNFQVISHRLDIFTAGETEYDFTP